MLELPTVQVVVKYTLGIKTTLKGGLISKMRFWGTVFSDYYFVSPKLSLEALMTLPEKLV